MMGALPLPVLLALLCVWVCWGATYAGMHAATASFPPFVMSAIRFGISGAIIYAVAAARGERSPTRSELRASLVTGAALLVLGNSFIAWSTHLMPSGTCALIVSLAPAFMLGFDALLAGVRPARSALVGVVIGFAGLCWLIGPQWGHGLPPFATLLALTGTIAWAFGTIYSRRFGGGRLFISVATQMLAASVMLAICALVLGEWRSFDRAAVTPSAYGGLGFLIAGGLIAYCAYLYLVARAPTAIVSTYAYVNPIIAVLLGIWLFHERVSGGSFLAIAVIITGVAFMVLPTDAVATVTRSRFVRGVVRRRSRARAE